MPPPIDPSQLIFPSAHTSIRSTLTSLKRSGLSISNRLRSIKHDAEFVEKVADDFPLPLLANERCGSWYIPPSRKAGSVYFKSTDGHHGQWSFSLRRLNLYILDVIGENGGCIIVDSTRRGKSMPDALSKTVPIWIAVLNRLLFPDHVSSHALRTPEDVVSTSEHTQIEQGLPGFLSEVRGLGLDIEKLRSNLHGRPMEVAWMTPDGEQDCNPGIASHNNLIILCTASGRTISNKSHPFDYVQGAADDSESWATGLTPVLFWSESEQLLSASEEELPRMIATLSSGRPPVVDVRKPVPIKPTSNIWISNNPSAHTAFEGFDVVVCCAEKPDELLVEKLKDSYHHLPCSAGKNGSRQLRLALPKLTDLASRVTASSKILVACPTGCDLAVGAALAIICLCCGDDGDFHPFELARACSKTMIKHRLSWIMISMPDAAPSRATLQSVNAFLLG